MKKRVFAAIELSPEAKEKAAAYVEALRGDFRQVRVGWEKPEKLHLTLKFFGDIDAGRLDGLKAAAEKAAAALAPFSIGISGTGVFPDQRKPRILWLGVIGGSFLPTVHESFEKECAKIGFQKEKRRFHPHLTIGRLREPRRSSELVAQHLANEFETVESEVTSITLMESKLLPAGSVYEVVHRAPFRKQNNIRP